MRSIIILFHWFGYVLLITPPRAIDLTVSERASRGELASQSLFIVMLVELLIRIALVLLVAVSLESFFGNTIYETYLLDTVFSVIVILGTCHSFSYFVLLGYLRRRVGLRLAMRLYRLLRNLCYSAIPGFMAVLPLLLWKWSHQKLPFEDGLVFDLYLFTTLLMIVIGMIEALIMKRKPLGLDVHLSSE